MPRLPRLTVLGAAGASALALVLALPPGGPASADAGTDVVARQSGWYSATSTGLLAGAQFAPGDMPVGRGPQGEDKRAVLLIDVPAAAQSATIALRPSTTATGAVGTAGAVLACLVTEPFTPGANGDIADAPARDCNQAVTGAASPTGGFYTFDITPFVQRWSGGEPNNGLSFEAGTGGTPAWQVTFSVSEDERIGTAALGPPADDGFVEPAPVTAEDVAPFFAQGSLPVAFDPIVPLVQPEPPGVEAAPAIAPAAPPRVLRPAGAVKALPVNAAVWLVFPVGLGLLWLLARSLTSAGEPRSALDRLLP